MKIVATFFEKIAIFLLEALIMEPVSRARTFLLTGHRSMADKLLSAKFE
jgi:hypothetical protein